MNQLVNPLESATRAMEAHLGPLNRHPRCQCLTCLRIIRGDCLIAQECETEGRCYAFSYSSHRLGIPVHHDKCPRITEEKCSFYKSNRGWRIKQDMQGAIITIKTALRRGFIEGKKTSSKIPTPIKETPLDKEEGMKKFLQDMSDEHDLSKALKQLEAMSEPPEPILPICPRVEDCRTHNLGTMFCHSGFRCFKYPVGFKE